MDSRQITRLTRRSVRLRDTSETLAASTSDSGSRKAGPGLFATTRGKPAPVPETTPAAGIPRTRTDDDLPVGVAGASALPRTPRSPAGRATRRRSSAARASARSSWPAWPTWPSPPPSWSRACCPARRRCCPRPRTRWRTRPPRCSSSSRCVGAARRPTNNTRSGTARRASSGRSSRRLFTFVAAPASPSTTA